MSNYVPGVPWNVNTSGTGPDAARAIATEKAAAQAQVKSIEAQIAKERADLKTQQNNLALKEAEIVEYKKSQTPKLKPEGPGTPNLGQQAVINTFEVAKGKIQEKIVAINSKLRTLDNRLKAFKNQLAAVI